jgi:hypothetical protein
VTTTRRQFLGRAAAAMAALALPLRAVAAPAPPPGRERVPGEIVEIPWPWGRGVAGVRLVHRVDGVGRGSVPVAAPRGILLPRVSVVLLPPDGRLRPGRHGFVLEAPGARWDLGGYDVAGFRFGC